MKTYFILDSWNRAVKVGKSVNPERRLKQLQTGHAHDLKLIGVLEGDHEKRIHTLWQPQRLTGEWFTATDDLLLFIYRRTQGPLALGTAAEKCLDGKISYEQHLNVLRNAYTKYQAEAISVGVEPEALIEPVQPLPNSSVVTVAAHQQHLNHVRSMYRHHLDTFCPPTTTHDTGGHTVKTLQPRLVRKPNHNHPSPNITTLH